MTVTLKSIILSFFCSLAAQGSQAQTNGLFIDSSDQLHPIISIELPAETLRTVEKQEDYRSLLAFFLVRASGISTIPVSGRYTKGVDQIHFEPLTDLGNDLLFSIRHVTKTGDKAQTSYRTPKAVLLHKNPPEVLQIYPASEVLPENILCFHVLFDRPMVEDPGAYEKARIFSDGKEVPFVWKHAAYWTHGGRLLVLMVHPGRVKRGISYLGKAFEAGRSYTLVIEQEIKDPQGRMLTQSIRKEFSIGKADHKIPKIKKAKMVFPEAADLAPIQLTFSEAMDFACMVEGLQVLDASDNLLPVSIAPLNDQVYEVTPLKAWPPGTYRLVLTPVVGDLCGNRFNRKFETTQKPSARLLNTSQIFEFVVE